MNNVIPSLVAVTGLIIIILTLVLAGTLHLHDVYAATFVLGDSLAFLGIGMLL